MANNRIKGITVEIGGDTKKLSDSLKKVDSSLKDTETRLKDVNKLLKLDPKNTELLSQKQELLSKAIEDTSKKLEMEKNALEQLKAAPQTEETIQKQKDLEREIVATTQSLQGYQDQLKKTGVNLEDIAKKAGTVAEKTKALSAGAAALGTGLLANAVASAAAADDLNTLAKQTGFTVEELQKMQYASDLIDVSMENMTGSMKKLTSGMNSGNKAFETLGVAVRDSNGNLRDSNEVWYETLQALSQVSNETERDALAMQIFGKSASELSGIIDDGGASLMEYGQEAEDLGLIMSQDMVDDANEFNDAVDKMKSRTSAAIMEMGASLAGTLVPAMEKVLDWVTKLVQWFANLDGTTQKVILVVAGLVAAISPVAGIISKITDVTNALSSAFTFICSPMGAVVLAIGAVVAAGVLLIQNWDTIKEKATALWETIKSAFENIKNAIKLPHFKVDGSFSFSLKDGIRLPKISVDWYAKAMQNGMILNSPTIFGYQNGRLLGGGEAGSEVVVGTNRLMQMIAQASGSGMTVNMTVNGGSVSANELADIVIDKLTTKLQRQNQRW
jgi:phage-related minor tail protein